VSARWKATIFYRAATGQLVDVEHTVADLADLDPIAQTLATVEGICIQPIEQAAKQ